MSRVEERRLATELGVLDARTLIAANYSAILSLLTSAQIDQVQRQLDADIINGFIEQQGEANDQKSIVGRTNTGHAVRDPSKAAVTYNPRMSKVVINAADTIIRVDYHKLLSSDTFVPKSDNPDEAIYLLQIKMALASKGVWLRFFSNASQMARTQYATNDPRRWFAVLSYGTDPQNELKTATGQITRRELLGVTSLGSGYYQYVHNGPTLKFLNRAIDSVASKIDMIRRLHDDWDPEKGSVRGRLLEWGVVNGVGNGMLGLNIKYPDKNIWNDPSQTLALAREQKTAGKLSEATKLAAFAALQAEWGARAVEEYANFINATKGAAGFVLQVLQVLDTLGDIADALLLVRQLGKTVIKRLGGITLTVGEQAPKTVISRHIPEPLPKPVSKYHGREAHAPTHYPGYQEEQVAYQKTIDEAAVKLDVNATIGHSQPPRIASKDRYDVALWDNLDAKHAELSREIRAYQKKHGGAVPIRMLSEITDRLDRKYGFMTFGERMGGK